MGSKPTLKHHLYSPYPRPSNHHPKVYVKPKRDKYNRNPIQNKIQQFKRFVENYRRHIVCSTIVYGITAGLALERCYCEFWCSFLLTSIVASTPPHPPPIRGPSCMPPATAPPVFHTLPSITGSRLGDQGIHTNLLHVI